jgi:hypothetical protein
MISLVDALLSFIMFDFCFWLGGVFHGILLSVT